MKNVTNLTVTQIRIFQVDVVPISVMTTKSSVERMRESLSFTEVEVRPFTGGKDIIVFRKGELRKEKQVVVVKKIEVDPRRVIVEVEGTSDDGNEVSEAFLSAVAVVANVDPVTLHAPLLVVEATQCVVDLDFTFDSLFSESFVKFMKNKVARDASSKVAKASAAPIAATVEIKYEITDKRLSDNQITMNPKQFSIAPRQGAPLQAKKYVVSSPFDSDTHLKLLEELNKVIMPTSKTP